MYEKYYKQFVDNFNLLSQRYDKYRIFLDFLKLASYSMYNVFRKSEEIESKYLNIVKTYRKDELEIFCKMFGELTLMYEYKNEIVDILGEFYTISYSRIYGKNKLWNKGTNGKNHR